MRIYQPIAGLCLAALLSACGGGGEGESISVPPTASTTTFPLATVMANYVNERKSSPVSLSGTATASGQNISVTGSATLSEAMTSSTFEGAPALRKTSTLTGTLDLLGDKFPIADTSAFFFDTNYSPLGRIAANNYCVVTSKTPIPVTVRIGDNGNWFAATCYTSSSKLTRVGGSNVSYAIEPDGASTALMKIVYRAVDAAGNNLTSTETYRVTIFGAVTRVGEVGFLSQNGVTFSYVGQYQ